MHVRPIYSPMLLYMCIHTIHTYEMACLIDATYYNTYYYSLSVTRKTGSSIHRERAEASGLSSHGF